MIAYYLVDIIYKFIFITVHHRLVGHDHIQLPGMQRQVTQQFHTLPGKGEVVPVNLCHQIVFPGFNPKAVLFQQIANQ